MASPEPRRDRALLVGWIAAAFAVSAVTDLRALGALGLLALAVFHRGALGALRRVALGALPLAGAVSGMGALWAWTVQGAAPEPGPHLALVARACLLVFLAFSVLARVDLLRAVAPWPTASRLLVLTLAQIHALRLLASESLQGLRSRLPRKPGAGDLVRDAGGVTAALLTLSTRNAREISEAMRSRGFS